MSDSKPTPPVSPSSAEASIGRLVADASRDLSALVRSEIELAKAELKISVTSGGLGTVFLLIAAFLGHLLLILSSITVAFFLTMAGMHAAWAFLIVCGLYLLIIVGLCVGAFVMFRRIRSPQQTIATAKAIPQALKGRGVR